MSKQNDMALLIPHYNNPEGLFASIQSIDEEEEVDVIVVDDGSSKRKIDESRITDSLKSNLNIVFLYLKENQGIEFALNKGLSYIDDNAYTYFARLDCGDICMKNRLKKQKKFLNDHPEVGILGSYVTFFDTNGKDIFDLKLPTRHREIKKRMFLNCMFIHPSVMIRSEVLKNVGFYPTQFNAAEDYAYFFNILKKYKGANIDQYLVKCEMNPKGISLQKRKEQIKCRIRLILQNFQLGFYPIYGLVRNVVLLIIPNNLVVFLKRVIK